MRPLTLRCRVHFWHCVYHSRWCGHTILTGPDQCSYRYHEVTCQLLLYQHCCGLQPHSTYRILLVNQRNKQPLGGRASNQPDQVLLLCRTGLTCAPPRGWT